MRPRADGYIAKPVLAYKIYVGYIDTVGDAVTVRFPCSR